MATITAYEKAYATPPGGHLIVERYSAASGKTYLLDCEVYTKDEAGINAFCDGGEYGYWLRRIDYNRRTTFGWRVWDETPTDTEMKEAPWKDG